MGICWASADGWTASTGSSRHGRCRRRSTWTSRAWSP